VKVPPVPVLGVGGLLVEPGDEAPPGDAAVELLVPASLHERAATTRWKLETPQAQPRHLLVI
jgi:hypothetical protein